MAFLTDLGNAGAADSPLFLCHTGYADQPYLYDVAAGRTLVPTHILCADVYRAAHRTNQNLVYTPTRPLSIDYLGNRDGHSNRQIQRRSIMHYATSSITVAATPITITQIY